MDVIATANALVARRTLRPTFCGRWRRTARVFPAPLHPHVRLLSQELLATTPLRAYEGRRAAVDAGCAPSSDVKYEKAQEHGAGLGTGGCRPINRTVDRGRPCSSTDFPQQARNSSVSPAPALYAALARAEHARDQLHALDAYREYAAALDDAERWSVPADLAAVIVSYGNALIADSKLDQASEVIGRVARWADHDFDCASVAGQAVQRARTGGERRGRFGTCQKPRRGTDDPRCVGAGGAQIDDTVADLGRRDPKEWFQFLASVRPLLRPNKNAVLIPERR